MWRLVVSPLLAAGVVAAQECVGKYNVVHIPCDAGKGEACCGAHTLTPQCYNPAKQLCCQMNGMSSLCAAGHLCCGSDRNVVCCSPGTECLHATTWPSTAYCAKPVREDQNMTESMVV
eukprot:TRINITY_DN102283_c0_g1_i1.p1 TRINITY_DN102283_c0_g1~~TRINITY_DN102283_c0_g1_i1.p1  ORF type:complete len:118 (-),score=9.89 TRINITY_DN102283_c0_g1_i1:272-625(-)